MSHLLRGFVVFLLFAGLSLVVAAATPTTLKVVDLRYGAYDMDYYAWVGCLQGIVNRADGEAAVFLITNEEDAAWADELVRSYGLTRQLMTARALLDEMLPQLNGVVLYDGEKPWERNVALTMAAAAAGNVLVKAKVATEPNTELEVMFDTQALLWPDRVEAYAWETREYTGKTEANLVALAPESGNMLADLIVARRLMAVDYNPAVPEEAEGLSVLAKSLFTFSTIIGNLDDRCVNVEQNISAEKAAIALTTILGNIGVRYQPARNIANLSCYARFPATRILMQGRGDLDFDPGRKLLMFVYDTPAHQLNGSSLSTDARSLDSVMDLRRLLDDPTMNDVPVGVQIPLALFDYAPVIYQRLLARQRLGAFEFLASPGGVGWLAPYQVVDPANLYQDAAKNARAMDINGATLREVDDQTKYTPILKNLQQYGWRGSVLRPEERYLQDGTPRSGTLLPDFTGAVAVGRVHSIAELRKLLADNASAPLVVVYTSPGDVPPSALRSLLPAVAGRTIAAPSMAFRTMTEWVAVNNAFKAQREAGIKEPVRVASVTQLTAPTVTSALVNDKPLTVMVNIIGEPALLSATLMYISTTGKLGSVDLRNSGTGVWTGKIPPMLTGGTLRMTARIVEKGTAAVNFSPEGKVTIPHIDADNDGADDTMEMYSGSDPHKWDTDEDGLPDGLDPHPTIPDRDVVTLSTPVAPPLDAPYLAAVGASTITGPGRHIPEGTEMVYRLPLKGVPVSPCAIRIVTSGMGTAKVMGNPTGAITLNTSGYGTMYTDIPVAAELIVGDALLVTLKAGDLPLDVISLALTSNPDGPFMFPVEISADQVPANVPLPVRVKIYSPAGIKSVFLQYGSSTKEMTKLEMKPIAGMGGVYYSAPLPAQPDGEMQLIGVIAEDKAGHTSAGPFRMVTFGRNTHYSVALAGGTDLTGSWTTTPTWGNMGRSLSGAQPGTDSGSVILRPGTYHVWLLAAARERGVAVKVEDKEKKKLLSLGVRGGIADGWYRLGDFDINELMKVDVTVTPFGPKGYAAYGEVVITADDGFLPGTPNATVMWMNALTLRGVHNGDTVKDTITVELLATGNIDSLGVAMLQTGGTFLSSVSYPFQQIDDTHYELDIKKIPPGNYAITGTGYRELEDGRNTVKDPIITVTVNVKIK